ncbi:MAG: hypothetical protein L3J24_07840 [Xanthomonadales bacterium]|nr:hypothetical protein [Xanthomonadales bacterium]
MKTKIQTSLLLAAGFLLSAVALADGSHSIKIEFESQLQAKIEITVHNGKDKGPIPHKVYYLDGPGKRTLKCHGQLKNRCRVVVSITGATLLDSEWVYNKEKCVMSKTGSKYNLSCN